MNQMNESNEWMNQMNQMNEWMNQMNEWIKWTNERINDLMNEWMNEWMNESNRMNQMNECMNEWMNEWMNESNEWYIYLGKKKTFWKKIQIKWVLAQKRKKISASGVRKINLIYRENKIIFLIPLSDIFFLFYTSHLLLMKL